MEIDILIQDFWKRIFLVLKNNVMSFLVVKHSKKMNVIRYSIHIKIFSQPSFRWKLFDQIEYFAHYQQNQSKLIQFSALVSTPKKSLLSSSGKLKFHLFAPPRNFTVPIKWSNKLNILLFPHWSMKTQGGEIEWTLFRVKTKFHLVSKVLVSCCVFFLLSSILFYTVPVLWKVHEDWRGEAIPITAGLEQTINKVPQRGEAKSSPRLNILQIHTATNTFET